MWPETGSLGGKGVALRAALDGHPLHGAVSTAVPAPEPRGPQAASLRLYRRWWAPRGCLTLLRTRTEEGGCQERNRVFFHL